MAAHQALAVGGDGVAVCAAVARHLDRHVGHHRARGGDYAVRWIKIKGTP